jgi:sporadic carbohydrate cluster 2OG-Fe(II) oxygenase
MITDKNILENYTWQPDPKWDNQILSYDTNKHNWAEWFLESVKELKPTLENLEDVHLYFNTQELIGLRKHLEKLTNSKEFSQRLDAFFEGNIATLLPDPDYLIQSTCGIRVVVPNQEPLGRLLSFHTGYWTGYSNDMGTVWTPLTRTFESNSMQVLSWPDSVELMNRIHNEHWDLDQIQSACVEQCYPVNINVGQSWLFNQGHLHGNINNNTGITRMSFDARWALPNGDFGPRRAGSFYRTRGSHAVIDKSQLNNGLWIVFVDQNSRYIGETPHYMIREFLLQFARGLGITPAEWSNEYWACTWMPKFRDYVNRNTLAGIILPSIHAFSCDIDLRLELIDIALSNNIQLVFADENLLIANGDDVNLIKQIYNIGKQ